MARILTFEDAIAVGVVIGVSAVVKSIPIGHEATVSTAVNVPNEPNSNPLLSLLGKYRDEPLWEGFEEALQIIRNDELLER